MNHSSRADRQILALLGNQWVVFAKPNTLPRALRFDPLRDSSVIARIADVSEASEARIASSLQIADHKRITLTGEPAYDAAFENAVGGPPLMVNIKVRDHDPRRRDYEPSEQRIKDAEAKGETLEVWFFNRERIKLIIVYREAGRFHYEDFQPIDVWERYEDSVFMRQKVVDEVEGWQRSLDALYEQVTDWLVANDSRLCFERSRTVTMSEELMQLFAVADRELPILDIVHGEQSVASLIPRGLWLIGARGRVDIITQSGTRVLIGDPDSPIGNLRWLLVGERDRTKTEILSKGSLISMVEAA